MNQLMNSSGEEWLKILDKGMVTLPKKWRDEIGIAKGDVVRAKRDGNRVIIEGPKQMVPYRIFTDSQIDEFLEADKLSDSLFQKVRADLSSR